MILCVNTACLQGQAMCHIALVSTTMNLEKHFRIPDYLPAPWFGTKGASNIHMTKSPKLLHELQYYFYEYNASQDMTNSFYHTVHFMGSPTALTFESPLNASLHDISSELLLFGPCFWLPQA
jgi:hypothetical protein